jgi:hypothetical protein
VAGSSEPVEPARLREACSATLVSTSQDSGVWSGVDWRVISRWIVDVGVGVGVGGAETWRHGDMETWRHRDIHLRPLEGALNRKHGHGALAKESDTTQPGRICPHFPVAGVGKPDQER